jgi:hypothetical protein
MLTTDMLNKNSHVGYVKSTRIKKQEDTYALEFDVSRPIEEFIELYLKTGLFIYVEPDFKGNILVFKLHLMTSILT